MLSYEAGGTKSKALAMPGEFREQLGGQYGSRGRERTDRQEQCHTVTWRHTTCHCRGHSFYSKRDREPSKYHIL